MVHKNQKIDKQNQDKVLCPQSDRCFTHNKYETSLNEIMRLTGQNRMKRP